MTGVAALCVIAHLFALAHLVVVQHVPCPEHGELSHVSSHATESFDAPISPGSPGATTTDAALPGPPDQPDGDHEHCLSAAERRDLYWGRVDIAALMPLAQCQSLHRHATILPVACALYRSAPKTSPPQFA